MKILLVNKYLYEKGGDAICTLETGCLLAAKGHDVFYWGMRHPRNPPYPDQDLFVSYVDLEHPGSLGQKLRIAGNILYSFEARSKVEQIVRIRRPDIVHLHNFAHQISPSILDGFRKYRIPVVMTMHDYKLVCAAYTLFDHEQPCEACSGGEYFRCFLHGCVKQSRMKSALSTVEMYLHHRFLKSYDIIDAFIAPSRFLRDKMEEMGFHKRVIHIPNFIDPGKYVPAHRRARGVVCYFGRLAPEKGLSTLIKALDGTGLLLNIIGAGPLRQNLERMAAGLSQGQVIFSGYKIGGELLDLVRSSAVVVMPSICHENNPRMILEAFALGKPVIGSRIGGIPELIEEGKTGYTFMPGNPDDLRDKLLYIFKENGRIEEMGRNARQFVEFHHDPQAHYQALRVLYESVLHRSMEKLHTS